MFAAMAMNLVLLWDVCIINTGERQCYNLTLWIPNKINVYSLTVLVLD